MQMQDYDVIIKRLEGFARRAETYGYTKEDLVMNILFMADDFRLAQDLQEKQMIQELEPA